MSAGKAAQLLFKFADEIIDAAKKTPKGGRGASAGGYLRGGHNKHLTVKKQKWGDPRDPSQAAYTTGQGRPTPPLTGKVREYVGPDKTPSGPFVRLADGTVMPLEGGVVPSAKQIVNAYLKKQGIKVTAAKKRQMIDNLENKLSREKGIVVRPDGPGDSYRKRVENEARDRTSGGPPYGVADDAADAADAATDGPPRGRAARGKNGRKRTRMAEAKLRAAGAWRRIQDGPPPNSPGDPWVKKFMANRERQWKEAHPMMRTAGVIGGVDLAMYGAGAAIDMVEDSTIGKAFAGIGGDAEYAELQGLLQESKRAKLLHAYHRANENQRVQDNALELARRAPDIFEQVMAGRMLPQDAVSIGGQRRVDLLAQVGAAMGTGMGVPQMENPTDILNQIMGGGTIQ